MKEIKKISFYFSLFLTIVGVVDYAIFNQKLFDFLASIEFIPINILAFFMEFGVFTNYIFHSIFNTSLFRLMGFLVGQIIGFYILWFVNFLILFLFKLLRDKLGGSASSINLDEK